MRTSAALLVLAATCFFCGIGDAADLPTDTPYLAQATARPSTGGASPSGPAAKPAVPNSASGAKSASGSKAATQASTATVQLPVVAVLPFVSLRRPEDAWIGSYVQDAIRRRIGRGDKLRVVSRDVASQRAASLNLEPLSSPTGVQWADLGLDYLIVGTVQRVLDRASVQVRVLNRNGDVVTPAPLKLMADLKSEAPGQSIAPLVNQVAAAFKLPEEALPSPASGAASPTAGWSAVEAAFRLAGEAGRGTDADQRVRLITELQPLAKDPDGAALEAEALLRLEQAQLSLRGVEQVQELGRALDAARRALDVDPENSERRALMAEIHFFLKQDYQARTEASVARLKNPLEGLAWAVLGLVAGPSTGEGTEHLKRARQVNPFLWQSARAPGTPPFQGGVLESTLSRWAGQHAAGVSSTAVMAARADKAESKDMREGIAAFETKRWDVADAAFRRASEDDEYDYRPVLYQLRILIETGRSAEAAPALRDLAAENPLEIEIQLYLGIALEKAAAYEDARQAFQRVLQDDPQQPLALLHIGTSANAQRSWNEAIDPLRTLVGIQPRNADAWLQLGIAQANLEQWAGADESFKQVLAINPKSQLARDWRNKIRPMLGK